MEGRDVPVSHTKLSVLLLACRGGANENKDQGKCKQITCSVLRS